MRITKLLRISSFQIIIGSFLAFCGRRCDFIWGRSFYRNVRSLRHRPGCT